jgi:VWFA-related protein
MQNLIKSFAAATVFSLVFVGGATAQSTGTSSSKPNSSSQTQQQQTQQQTQQQKPSTEAPPAAGGPQGDIGPIAVPKKAPEESKPVEKPEKVKNPEGLEDFSLRVNVPLVSLDVSVLTKDGQFIPGLKKENFRVLEDGVPQPITNFSQTQAPITAALLVEFANTNYNFIYDMLNAAYTFTGNLKPEDWVAVISYDMKPQIIVDFTQDKRAVAGALNTLRIPGFSETNLFDALYDTLDRMEGLEGRKYIVLISSGRDTFSKLTLDKIMNKIKASHNISIYAVGTGQAAREYYDARGAMGPLSRLDYLQADNQLKTFAQMTGGKAYFPRFEGEMPEIFGDIAQTIRNQYTIAYHPTNAKQDGSYRKLKVEVVAPDGGPLRIQNEKGKALKYQVIAREGYKAKQAVE